MFKKKSLILICMCFALLMSACGISDILPVKSESLPAAPPVHSDWKAYYTEILNGTLPEALIADLQQRRLPATRDSFRSYFVCDWDNDGTPELFLEAIQTRYVFVIAADESVKCLDVYGINPQTSALVAKGTEGLTVDPGADEWSVYLPGSEDAVYFNLDADEMYTVIDPVSGDNVTASSSEKAEALYRQLFKKYIPDTVPLKYISGYPLSNSEGLNNKINLSSVSLAERQEACRAFHDFCENESYYDYPIEFFNEVSILKTFFDFEQDGIPELILTNASSDSAKLSAFVFEYIDGEIKLIGKGPECSYYTECIRNILLGFVGNAWTLYTKDGTRYNIKLLETGNQYLPTSNDNIYMVKGFPIQELPYNTFARSYALEMSFYRA